jgi:membrane-bound ClpP family serine protease
MLTIVLGMALIVLGLVGFYATGATHYTALIPAGFGVVFFLSGLVALKQSLRKHAMHVTSMLGLLGFAFTVPGLLRLPALLSGGAVERPGAMVSKSVMAILCGAYFILCVMSFVAARLRRRREAPAP